MYKVHEKRSRPGLGKTQFLKTILLTGLLLLAIKAFPQEKIKIGYVGNSITAANHNRYWFPLEFEAYSDNSALLIKQYFGDVAEVDNFGDGGKTLTDMIDPAYGTPYTDSYMRQPSFQDALNFNSDILFISLGTNDGRTNFWPDTDGNRGFVNEFYDDYLCMIDSFKLRNPDTYFILGYPPPVFGPTGGNYWVDTMMERHVRPEIDKVIAATGVDSIDWHRLCINDGALYPDNLHPNKEGSKAMGQYAFEKMLLAGIFDTVMVKTGLALNMPAVTSSQNGSNTGEKAVDSDPQSCWETSFSGSESLCIDLGLDYDIDFVRLVWRGKYTKAYQLQVSSDSVDWVDLRAVNGDTLKNNLHLELDGHGRYIRLNVNDIDSTTFALNEFDVFGVLHLEGEDITDLGGTTAAQYASASSAGPEYAIDNTVSSKFLTYHKEAWLQYSAPSFCRVYGYTVTAGSEGTYNPVKWILQASVNNTDWVALDSAGYDEEITFSLRYEKKRCLINDTTKYAFFRLILTSATNTVHIGEWEIFGEPAYDRPKHNVTLSAQPEGISPNLGASGTFVEYDRMQITAGPVDLYRFIGWSGSDDDVALLTDPGTKLAQFIMPDRDVSFIACYELLSTDIAGTPDSKLSIYPNPVKDILYLSGIDEQPLLSIFSLSGQKLKSEKGLQISVSDLSNGIYILSVLSQAGIDFRVFTKV